MSPVEKWCPQAVKLYRPRRDDLEGGGRTARRPCGGGSGWAIAGLGTDAPSEHAQALFSRLMSDPRFQAAFSDSSMLVTSRDDAVVYVATVLRTPGVG